MKRKTQIAFALCLVVAVTTALLLPLYLEKSGAKIYDNVIRLHVISNTASQTDQEVKLLVRDAILEKAGYIFSGKDINQALEISRFSKDELTNIAKQVVLENGFDYDVRVELGRENYPIREYDGVTYPAGEYYSLRVVLGSGSGQNWWCVLFPPLCFGSSTLIIKPKDGESKAGVTKSVKIKFKFRLFDMFD